MRAQEFVKPHQMAKLEKTGRIVEILRHQDQVDFSDEPGWYLINLEPGKRVAPDMKWIPDSTRFSWVREFKRADAVVEDITPNTIHKLADRTGVKWDNEPSFLQLTKRLTGKEHLDDLNQTELHKVKQHLEKQGVAEGFSNTTFNVDRRKLNVPALIQKGAILVTHPHGEQGWETDNKEDWAFSLISLYNVLHGGWTNEAKKYLKPASYKKAEQHINSSAPNLGSDKLVYDGKYNQILWSIKKLGIPDNVAFLDKDQQGVAEAGNANSGRRGPDYQDNSPVVPGRVEHLPQGLRHHADASRYGGTEPDDKDDRLLGPQQRHRLHRAVTPDDLDEQEKIAGRHDPDDFDDMIGRLKKLAGAGPLKTVWDPAKRVYKNVPHAVQPAQQPKKAPQ